MIALSWRPEVGVVNENAENIRAKGRLEPGKMLLIDTEEQRIISDEEIKQRVATELPYDEWVKSTLSTCLKLRKLMKAIFQK